jgi:hypothetical protein
MTPKDIPIAKVSQMKITDVNMANEFQHILSEPKLSSGLQSSLELSSA